MVVWTGQINRALCYHQFNGVVKLRLLTMNYGIFLKLASHFYSEYHGTSPTVTFLKSTHTTMVFPVTFWARSTALARGLSASFGFLVQELSAGSDAKTSRMIAAGHVGSLVNGCSISKCWRFEMIEIILNLHHLFHLKQPNLERLGDVLSILNTCKESHRICLLMIRNFHCVWPKQHT